ncbi:stress response protein NST1-like [Dendronephthya gigantea]|uniref:stress response protein NST1-like n=1 Tax=Dendronephthya gigantea TaxID=151771 RepID=UPI00106C7026|nr:stress response protein NST1-like [Dendronephthya gigantea]
MSYWKKSLNLRKSIVKSICKTQQKKQKRQEDKENAEDMRLKAMETLKETQKRKALADGNEKREKRRSNGSEALSFLRERMDNENEYREKELDMRKKDVELEEKKIEREEKQHQDIMQMMQMQQMQMNFFQSQAQQQQLLMGIIEKLSK